MSAFEIKPAPLLGRNFEAVFVDGRCIGVIKNSCTYPWRRMFFSYADGGFYYGMTSEEALKRSFLRSCNAPAQQV